MAKKAFSFQLHFNTGQQINSQHCFALELARHHAKQQLLTFNRTFSSDGGVYLLMDCEDETIVEKVRLANKQWIPEVLEPVAPPPEQPRLKYIPMEGFGNGRIEARLGEEMVGCLLLETDKTKCAVRDRLAKSASHGNALWTQHVAEAQFSPQYPSLPFLTFMYALRIAGSNGMALASARCGEPAKGYDPKELFTNRGISSYANVLNDGDYYVAARR